MDRYPLAFTIHQTGRSPGIVGILLKNYSGFQNGFEVGNFKSFIPPLLIRVKRQKVLVGGDTILDPVRRQRITHG